jgi:hypothetical protein
MTEINLIFTCPHDGRKKGSTLNPPILKRVGSNLPADICPAADGDRFNDENEKSELFLLRDTVVQHSIMLMWID